jgi:uncharacterized protein (TIGR02453 family)
MFEGFPKATASFLAGLSRNNEKAWFEAHRDDYENAFLAPARAFIEAIGPRLKKLDKTIHADPKKSILRIHRDVRFSKDKSPYKDHLDLWFWSGEAKGWDTSGFFFRLTAKQLMLGAGMHAFMPPVLAKYRAAVAGKRGEALAKIATTLKKKGYDFGGESYKRAPGGYDADHPRAALLKHSGLFAGWHGPLPKELGSPKFVDFCATRYAAIAPVHDWLKGALGK